jgi:uncharacterized protein (DUF2141 family)
MIGISSKNKLVSLSPLYSYYAELPDWWSPNSKDDLTRACERRTRTVMLKERRMAKIPDNTYDLDGDGSVNERDYALAKMFDKDGDGKLNQEEY